MAYNEPDGLRPKLERAQATLQLALDQACSADLQDADTGELIRIEEVLAIANEAAKEAVSVRRRLGLERARADQSRDPNAVGMHREFEDGRGVRWLAFAVFPSAATTERSPLRVPFQKGWLAFDSGMETRRLAPIPEGWSELSNEQLIELCERAEVAPRRSRKKGDTPPG